MSVLKANLHMGKLLPFSVTPFFPVMRTGNPVGAVSLCSNESLLEAESAKVFDSRDWWFVMLTSEMLHCCPSSGSNLSFPKQPIHFQTSLNERWGVFTGSLPWGCPYPLSICSSVCGYYTHIQLTLITVDLNQQRFPRTSAS